MGLEGLIFDRLDGDERLRGLLARYDQRGAVFYQRAPVTGGARWAGTQYPRVDFSLDLREEPENNKSGALIVNIWCTGGGAEPEEIEAALVALLHMAFVRMGAEGWYGVFWSRTDAFESGAKDGVYGASVLFDVMGLPGQVLGVPDPVRAIGDWMKSAFDGAGPVSGGDRWAMATDAQPFVYWRAEEILEKNAQFACEWMECALNGHVFAPSAAARLQVAAKLRDAVADAGHAMMDDGGPMRFIEARLRPGGDYLTGGQVRLRAEYGRMSGQGAGGATGDVLLRVTVRGIS